MSQKANYFKIGMFVIIALVLGVVGLVMLGLRTRLQRLLVFETYIDESVQGLDVGSPVKYRGVRVGEVKEIDLAPREREDLRPHGARMIYVRMEIRPRALGLRKGEDLTQKDLDVLIDRGLRVRLAAQGITGVMYLETDYFPNDKNAFRPPDVANLYVPSTPSTFMRFTDALDSLFRKLDHVDIEQLAKEADQLIENVNHIVAPERMDHLLAGIEQVVENANRKIDEVQLSKLVAQLDEILGKVKGTLDAVQVETLRTSVSELIDETRTTNRQVQDVLRDARVVVANVADASKDLPPLTAQARSAFKHVNQIVLTRGEDIDSIMENLRVITEHLKGLSSGAEKYPSQVLFGSQPTVPEARKP